jgi:hypothetical protein
MVARLLGLDDAREFDRLRPQLEARGFPGPDPVTGRWCVEAVDRWRHRRHPHLFPELTAAPTAVQAEAVFHERMRRLGG